MPNKERLFHAAARNSLQSKIQNPKSTNDIRIPLYPPASVSLRLAIVLSHPVQYYSPWFRHLAAREELSVKVFYLWDFGVKETRDRAFGESFTWDIPLLEGYEHEFLMNRSADSGTHHFRGLDNPGAVVAVAAWKPDAVLLFGYSYVTQLRLILSRRLAGVPFYFRGDSHDLCRPAGWRPKVSRLLRKLLFRRFAGFLAVGEANAGYFRNCGVTDNKIHRVPHCVDNSRFQAAAAQAALDAKQWKQQLGIPHAATVVLFAGKFETIKRPLDLLEAFLQLSEVDGRQGTGDREQEAAEERSASTGSVPYTLSPVPSALSPVPCTLSPVPCSLSPVPSALSPVPCSLSAVLLFVGSGPLESALRVAAGEEIGRSVFFAPFQNQTAMPKVYQTGDVLVLPSQSETWGLAVNEAMNLARPAIVSSHVGCGPDLIVPGKTGWVFPAGDVTALRSCLAEATADPVRLQHMGEAARRHVAGFSYEVATEGLVAAVLKQ